MIMLITCLRDLSVVEFLNLDLNSMSSNFCKVWTIKLVVDFLELSRIELDHTLKEEIVPDDIIYKCVNL
jgi:hypothetical protein